MWEKLKKVNFKSTVRAFAIIWMLVLIVVMTITNIGINRDFNWLLWISNSMILFGITVFGLFIGESTAIDIQREKIVRDKEGRIVGGLFKKNLMEYNEFRKQIDGIHMYFSNWYDWWVPQRRESKYIEFLICGGMNATKAKNIVKYCTLDNFFDLRSHAITLIIDGKEVNIRKLQENEVEPVEMVLKGKVEFKMSGTGYYLQAFAESNQRDVMEQGEAYKQARAYNKISNRIIRIGGGLLISLALGILTVNDFMKGDDIQAWMNLVTRIANLFTALFSGYLSGVDDVRLQAEAIANKTDVLKMFKSAYDRRMFEILDEDQAAKREADKYREEVKADKDNVFDAIEPHQLTNKMG